MNTAIFNLIIALIPVIGAIITTYLIPYLKSKTTAQDAENIKHQIEIMKEQYETAEKWVAKAVEAAEVLFPGEKQGINKREWVIDFIDKEMNKEKEVITKEQIRVLLEAFWKTTIAVSKEI